MDDRQERIRAKAYELWEQAGRPEGQESVHWAEAERQIDAENGGSAKAESSVNPEQTGPAQPDQVETVDTPIPVKRQKKASVRPTRKRPEPG